MQPETKYAKSGDVNIAYQVVGDGPVDLVLLPSWCSHVELIWQAPEMARAVEQLASFSRLILFDHRGTGLSDPVQLTEVGSLEAQMDDVRAVMDDAGWQSAAILGTTFATPLSALFAATHPDRVSSLVLYQPHAPPFRELEPETREAIAGVLRNTWGRPEFWDNLYPTMGGPFTQRMKTWLTFYQRMSMAPGAAAAVHLSTRAFDTRDIYPAVRVPTLVIDQVYAKPEMALHGDEVADLIPSSTLVAVPGRHTFWTDVGDPDVASEIEEFLTGTRQPRAPDRILSTVLFTDVVRSTEILSELGDRSWRDMLEAHSTTIRRQVERFQGSLISVAGEESLATFDGPARAIRCAVANRDALRNLGLEMRAGLHTGEIELLDEGIGGIAVHIGARVSSLAGPGEVLVSSTVKDLVAGSGLEFDDRGVHSLKGVSDEWRIFALKG
jgi:class 3 adenylate cyclase